MEEAAEQAGLDVTSPRVAAFLRVAGEVIGMPRHLSIHPGGFLLGRDPISRIVPQENATMEGRTVIQWDKHGVEEMSLFKVDLLGLGALTHLDFAFRLLERHLGVSMSMATIPMDVPRVYAMLRRAGACTQKLTRTGALPAVRYGTSVIGVTDAELARARRLIAHSAQRCDARGT